MDLVVLATCSNSINAHLIKSKLQSEGIPCFLNNEHFTNLMPQFYGILGSGVRVMINSSDLEQARQIISIDQGKVECPNCGSENLSLFPVKSYSKVLMMILSWIFVQPLGNLLDQYRCKECATIFRFNGKLTKL